jgi:hypothetical protein
MNSKKSGKPAVKSLGVWGSVGGVFAGLLMVAETVGYAIPEPVTLTILASATVASSVLGLLGRVKAKETIDSIFFSKD